MIQITPQMRILVAVEPVDFRKGIDGLVQICRQQLHTDPLAGALFVFANRRRRALKILTYDGQGFWLCQKRLSQGRFGWWPNGGQTPTLGLAVASASSTENSVFILTRLTRVASETRVWERMARSSALA